MSGGVIGAGIQPLHSGLPNKAPIARLSVPSGEGWQTRAVRETRLQSSKDSLWRSKDNCLEVYHGDSKSYFDKGRLLKGLAAKQGTQALPLESALGATWRAHRRL